MTGPERDHGHEPWVRANVRNNQPSTPEQVAEILASLDAARAEIERLHPRINRGSVRTVSVTQTIGTVGAGETVIGAVIGAVIGRVERRAR